MSRVVFPSLSRLPLASRRRRRRSTSSRSFVDQTWIAVLTIVLVPRQIGENRNVRSTTTFQIRKMQAVLEAPSSYKIKTLTQTQTLSNNTRRSQQKSVTTDFLSFSIRLSLDSISANVSFAKTKNITYSTRVSQSSTCAHKCTQILTKTLPRPQKKNGNRHDTERATTIH